MPKQSKEQQKLPSYDLKAERENRNLTQIETAKMLFTTQSTVARWEANGDTPQLAREYWKLYWQHQKPPKVSKVTNKTPAK